ncbi:hypothetical protein L7F22_006996, partial [Adiantum nelumboides]|nr:hypothetical protein [Adiantum nelumboides]
IEAMYGGRELFLLYLCGGVIGSWGHIIYHTVVYPRIKKLASQQYNLISTPAALGASGAVTTLTLLFILHNPNHPVLLMFVPMPAAV